MNKRLLQLAGLLNEEAPLDLKNLVDKTTGKPVTVNIQPANNGKTTLPPGTPPAQVAAGTPVKPEAGAPAQPATNMATTGGVSPAQPSTQATQEFNKRAEAIPQNIALQQDKKPNAMHNDTLDLDGVPGNDDEEKIENVRMFLGLRPGKGWTKKAQRRWEQFKQFRDAL
jgi:hypothetical protein